GELRQLEITSKGRVVFRDLDLPIDVVESEICKFIVAHGADAANTALLVEAGTAFGAAALNECRVDKSRDAKAPLSVRYPVHVALARSGSEKAARQDVLERVHNTEAEHAINLPLGFVREGDVPPSFFPDNAAVVSERMLVQELDALRARRIRFVGIFGTDPYDRIYLARLIRRLVPDAQLFLIFADVLYLHPAYTSDLLGTWVASSDPIDPAVEMAPLLRGEENHTLMDPLPNFLAAGTGRAVKAF